VTQVSEIRPQDQDEALVLGYFINMKNKDWEAFAALWHDDAVQQALFRPDGLDDFIPDAFVGRQQIVEHYKKALQNRREHDFWIDALHRTTDPECFIVECRGRSIVGENGRLYENKYVFVFKLREGKLVHLKEYADPLPIMRAFTGAF